MDVEKQDAEPCSTKTRYSRSLSDINALADIAGVTKRKGVVQELFYGDTLSSSNFQLLEVPMDVMEALKQYKSVEIRGEKDDHAVLCTENDTFDVRLAYTSNCLLLVEDMSFPTSKDFNRDNTVKPVKVHSSLGSYYELRKIRPRLDKLKMLLWEAPYCGPELDKDVPLESKYSFTDLQLKVQASDEQLMQALQDHGAVLIDGYWRTLDLDFREKAFGQQLKLLEEKDWSYLEVPLEESCSILEELYPKFVIEHCLLLHGTKFQSEDDSGKTYVRLSEDKVCRFFAECILRVAERFHLHEFLKVWKESVPDGMCPRDDHLKGLALQNPDSHPPSISHFPVSSLPEDPATRFNKLFKVRSRWYREDIEPYICDLVDPGQSMNSLFLKYARCSTDTTGRKIYNAKQTIT